MDWNCDVSDRWCPIQASASTANLSWIRRRHASQLTARPSLLPLRPAEASLLVRPLGVHRERDHNNLSSVREIAMASEEIAVAIERVESILQRRPEKGLHDDAAATARWQAGLKVIATDASGFRVETDMPVEMGGKGQSVTPGWLLRAGLASCTATRIAMAAAREGIALTSLELTATSSSDLRGMLGIADPAGATISAGPGEVRLDVRICAPGVSEERLILLVKKCNACSPVACALETATPVSLHIEVASH